MGDAGAVIAEASCIAEAAEKLGVTRVTVWRWIKAGKVPAPAGVIGTKPEGVSVADWASQAKRTESELLTLTLDAYQMARDQSLSHPVRLMAMGRYQSLVKQLHLEAGEKREAAPAPSRVALPTRRVTHDPRKILQAVK